MLTSAQWTVIRAFVPFFMLITGAFMFVCVLHRTYKRRAAQAAALRAPRKRACNKKKQRRPTAAEESDSSDDDDDDDDDNDGDDDDNDDRVRPERHRTAKQLAIRAEKQRIKELKAAWRRQEEERRERLLDDDDDAEDPRAAERAAERRAEHAAKLAEQRELDRWKAAAAAAAESSARKEREEQARRLHTAAAVVRRLGSVAVADLAVELDVPLAPLLAHVQTLADDGDGGLFLVDDGPRVVHVTAAETARVVAWVEQTGRFDNRSLTAAVNSTLG